MAAGVATTEDRKQDSSEACGCETAQRAPLAIPSSGRGAWGDGESSGAASGMPLYLQPQVQMKCAACAQEEEEQPQPPVQKKCAHCEAEEQKRRQPGATPVQAKCAACEAEGLKQNSATGAAADGVANANQPLPHLEQIQASFGRHDVSGARAAVGGEAAQATGSMGALAYTSGDRVAFGSQPDVNLAAHEAAHVVQQRNGAKLAGGVGRTGDGYEQQADAAAAAVERGESAEPILDRGVAPDAGGEAGPAVQHRLEVNAARVFEPPSIPSLGGLGGLSGKAGAAAANAKRAKSGKSAAAQKEDASESGAAPGAKPGAPAAGQGGAAGGPAGQNAGPQTGAPASTAPQSGASPQDGGAPQGAQPSGSQPSGSQPSGSQSGAPGGSAPAGQAPAADGNAGAAPAPAGNGAPAAAGANCTPACYHEPTEDPPESEQSDQPPANPPEGDSEEQTSEGDEQDLPEPDDCDSQASQAGVPGEGQGADASGGAPAADASTGGAAGAGPAASAGGGAAAGPANAAASGTAAANTPAGTAAAGGAGGAAAAAHSRGGGAAAGGGGGGAAPAAAAKAKGSPLDGSIAQSEGQRSAAVASFEASSQAITVSAQNTADLRMGVHFAAPDQAAEERADHFFADAADGLEQAIAFASGGAPDQLGAQAEEAKGQMLASSSAEKDAISARVAAGRDEARADASIAARAVVQQADSFVSEVQSGSAAALAALTASYGETMGQVDALETQSLDQVTQIYANGRTQLEGLGATVGDECTAIGEQFAGTYEGFEQCTENGFWDGDLSERRARAQAKAARKTAKGYHDRMVDAAKKRAREVTKNGRKNNRCAVIATARSARENLDKALASITTTIETARDQAVQQAQSARASLLASISSGLQSTLRQLDQQEHEQRQAVDDTCYLQQILQEQMAHSAAASIQGLVSSAAGSLHDTLFEFRQLFASNQPPDPQALEQVLAGVSQKINAALGEMRDGMDRGTSAALEQLGSGAAQGLAAMEALVGSNDESTAALTGGFGSQMGAIAGQDNFAAQRAGFTQMLQQATTGGTGVFQQILGATRDGCTKIAGDSQKSLTQAGADLEKNLRQSKQGIECQITKEADEAASHEPPAWKQIIAVLLIIIVIVIVIAVTVLTAGMALGPLAVIALGAVVGAVTSGLIAMAQNLLSNQSVMKGVGKAMLIGAIAGAAGGALGMGIGSAVGRIAGGIASKAVVEFASLMLTTAVMDVGQQFIEGGFSFKKFSLEHLGFSLAVALVTFGVGKAAESTGLSSAARGAVGIGEGPHAAPALAEPEPVPAEAPAAEPAPAEHPPAEPAPAEPAPAEPAPAEATPAEAVPAEPAPAPAEPAPAAAEPAPAPAESAPAEAAPAESTPGENAPAENAPGAAGEPGPAEHGPAEPAPAAEGEAPTTPEERETLNETANKSAEELTPEEIQTEREVASRTEGEPIDEPPFTTEKELPNDHEVKETPAEEEGPCERCSKQCAVFDSDGNLTAEQLDEGAGKEFGDSADTKGNVAEDVGEQLGREVLADMGINPDPEWVNPFADIGGSGQGFDDVMIGPDGEPVIAEYKGGESELRGDQMQREWVQRNITRLQGFAQRTGFARLTALANRLQVSLDAGTLRGVTVTHTIDPGTGLPTTSVQNHGPY